MDLIIQVRIEYHEAVTIDLDELPKDPGTGLDIRSKLRAETTEPNLLASREHRDRLGA